MDWNDSEQPKSRRKSYLWIITKNILLILVLVIAADFYHGRKLLQKGVEAPQYTLEWLYQKEAQVQTIPGVQKGTLIYYSAPWCGVCKVTGNNLKRASEWLRFLGKEIFAVEVALSYSSRQDLIRYSKDHGTKNLLMGSNDVLESYKVNAFPSFYFINDSGKVSSATSGYTSSLGLFIRALVFL